MIVGSCLAEVLSRSSAAASAEVAPTAYVGPDAMVLDGARVEAMP